MLTATVLVVFNIAGVVGDEVLADLQVKALRLSEHMSQPRPASCAKELTWALGGMLQYNLWVLSAECPQLHPVSGGDFHGFLQCPHESDVFMAW